MGDSLKNQKRLDLNQGYEGKNPKINLIGCQDTAPYRTLALDTHSHCVWLLNNVHLTFCDYKYLEYGTKWANDFNYVF